MQQIAWENLWIVSGKIFLFQKVQKASKGDIFVDDSEEYMRI